MPRTTRATRAVINSKAMEQNNDSYSDEDCASMVESRAHSGAAATHAHATDASEEMRAQGGAALDHTLGGAHIGAPAAADHTLGGAHIGAPAAALNTERLLSTMMESFARMQAETNRTLVESLRSLHHGNQWNHVAAASPTANVPATSGGGNFAKCTARFDGQSRDTEVLEAFIDAVEVYKECADVTDEHALRGLSMLLSGDAAVWWRGARTGVATWADALARLRAAYGVQRPAYRVLREIFAEEQSESERAEVFISKVRSLLVKLPYVVPSVMIVDIVYGLLHRRIRKRLSRDSVSNIDHLLERARTVEDSIVELSSNAIVAADKPNLPRVVDRSTSSPSATLGSSPTSNSDKRNRIRCSYCKVFGHPTNECRKARKVGSDSTDNADTSDIKSAVNASTSNGKSIIRCYGCGRPGVVKSKCETCSNKAAPAKLSDFNVVKGDCCTMTSSHPLVTIGVVGKEGVAIVDTGATHSVASPSLHALLVNNNVRFDETERYVGLADGSCHRKMVKTATVPVTLGGRRVDTEFMVFSGDDTRTLLGRDFIANAGMVIDIGQESWHFADSPGDRFPFKHSYTLNSAAVMHTDVNNVSSQQGKGKILSLEHRAALSEVSQHRVAQFASVGPPTNFAVYKVSKTQEPLASPPSRLSPPIREALENELLVSTPILRQADATLPFVLSTDNGGYALRADSLQGEGTYERRFRWGSRLLTAADLRENPNKDSEVSKFIKVQESDDPSRGRVWTSRGYGPVEDVPYSYCPENGDHDAASLVLPKGERAKVLADHHDAPTAGHMGAERTLQRIAGKYYWPGMRSYVTQCKKCVSRKRYKADTRIQSVPQDARDVYENAQAAHNRYADDRCQPVPDYKVSELVLLRASDTGRGQTPNFIPRRDGPYKVRAVVNPTTYILECLNDGTVLGKYHASVLTPFVGRIQAPVQEKRRRGRLRRS